MRLLKTCSNPRKVLERLSTISTCRLKSAAFACGGALLGYYLYNNDNHHISNYFPALQSCFAEAKSEPVFSSTDVAKHKTKDTGIWVSYKDGVYDITRFVDGHPGGDKIMLGAGGPIDPFWNMYAVHKTKEVLEILEEYRIGKLKVDSRIPPTEDNCHEAFYLRTQQRGLGES